MKIILLVITFSSIISSLSAQETKDSATVQIVEFPDVEAEYPGGMPALMKYLIENITYPADYGDVGFCGKIYISLIINVDGSVSDVKVQRGVDPKLDKMAKQIILRMPKWNPAETDGKAVRSRIRIPINILLE